MKKPKRTNLKPEDRRTQFLDCAEALFFSKGYDDTSVQDVLDMAGVSKGGFYHHFKSKDELMFGVIDRYAQAVFLAMHAIADNDCLSPLEQLHQYLHLEADHVKAGELSDYLESFRIMRADNNVSLLTQFNRRVREHAQPTLAVIVKRGVSQGVFTTHDPETAAALINHIIEFFQNACLDAVKARGTDEAPAAAQRLQKALNMQYLAVDRLLGLPDGTTNFGWPEMVDEVMTTRQLKQLPHET